MSARYTLIVGTKDWSSWSLSAYLTPRATGAAFEEVCVPMGQQALTTEATRQHSKSGSVPALKTDEEGRHEIGGDNTTMCAP